MKIEGLEKLQRKLRTLERFQDKMVEPTTKAVSLIHADMAKYVPKAKGAFRRLASPAQKRAYWARVKSGEISHRDGIGYVRSGTLGRKWTSKVSRLATGVRGVAGNNAKYAQLVQGDRQESFHAVSGWPTATKTLRKNGDKINRIYRDVVRRELNK